MDCSCDWKEHGNNLTLSETGSFGILLSNSMGINKSLKYGYKLQSCGWKKGVVLAYHNLTSHSRLDICRRNLPLETSKWQVALVNSMPLEANNLLQLHSEADQQTTTYSILYKLEFFFFWIELTSYSQNQWMWCIRSCRISLFSFSFFHFSN